MSMDLFDANASCLGVAPGTRTGISPEELVGILAAAQITRALIRILPIDMETDVVYSNQKLYAACAATPQFRPCPVVVPDSAHDLAPEDEQVEEAIAAGAPAVWIRPTLDCWLLESWVYDPLFHALEERRMPLLASEPLVGLANIARIAERFPRMPILMTDTGYRLHRSIQPLMERFGNIHLVLGGSTSTHYALEHIVRFTSAERIIFGTGAPDTEAMCAVSYLMYSALSDEEKALVGLGNMQRLLSGIII